MGAFPRPSITWQADGVLAWPQQEIAEEKWPGQAMRLSGLVPASPVQVGARPLVKLAAAALSSGLTMPPLFSLPPGPVAAWSPPALGEFFLSARVAVLISSEAGRGCRSSSCSC